MLKKDELKKQLNSKHKNLDELLQELDIYNSELHAQNDELLNKEKKIIESKLEYEAIFMNAPIPYILVDDKLIIKKINNEAMNNFDILNTKQRVSFLNILAKGEIKKFLFALNDKKKSRVELDMINKANIMTYILDIIDYPINEKWKLITLTSIQKEKELINIANKLNEEKVENYKDVLYSLIDMIEKRDPYTAGHSQRVARYSKLIAQELNLGELDIELVYEASVLHDIGKVVIPDSILLKPGNLTNIEYELVQEHAQIGFDLLKNIKDFQNIAKIIKYHHEREDGSGYPNGIKSDEIPILSKIIAVADSFDAMTTNRIYSKEKSKKKALEELNKYKNSKYDEQIVNIANDVLSKINIDEHINQNPISKMDKARFSYFYNDQLTGLYNKDYLNFMKNMNILDTYSFISKISIKKFSEYNKRFSWEKGNNVLKDLARKLLKEFEDGMIFRIDGDNFIILSNSDIKNDLDKIIKNHEDKELNFKVETSSKNQNKVAFFG